ncbi:hypothetical protein [Clostridium butyricum]|uniref:hypothetical protein n=1 Tax=Clostridium butyricum TaxID=1492 RepID=UPI00189E6098|nr:hypothetical protein [Clostridium butyricum]MDB2150521.1 hypothetical protein [Clostridium butyricum]
MSVIISEKQYKDSFIREGDIIFTPEVEVIIRENEKGVKYKEYIITKSAEEKRKEYSNTPIIKPSEGEVLMSNVILENATLKQQMVEQQELTANLLLQIAELKGGNANV